MPFTDIIKRLEQALPQADKINTDVSKRGVDWHLEHSLKIIKSISNTVAASDPKDFTPKFHMGKYYILWTNQIPRGKGRSPKPFDNKDAIDISKLPERFEDAKKGLASLESLHPKQHFRHPMFGDLNLKQAKKFIKIHTTHHLDIIEEIVAT